jgi:large repetitive protein
MSNNVRLSRGLVSRALGISALVTILFVAGCGSTPAKPTVGVAISPTGPVTLEQGGTASLTAMVTNDTASAGVTWSLTGAGSLTGNTTTAVTYNAPASVTAASVATVKATSVADSTKTATFTVNLVTPPSITPATLPGGNVGTPYSQTVSVTGGVAPYTLSITGTQITGVTFTAGATSATLSGIPTTAATFGFTVKVTDSGSPAQSSSVVYSVVIGAQLPLSITTSSLPGGTLNSVYPPVSINATGGFAPYSFGATGLPAGMNLSSGGSLTGTPTAAGSFSVTITVTDSETPTAATANVTLPLTITAPHLALAPGAGGLPNATQNAAYSASLTPSGGVGPYSIALDGTSAAMPTGLTFNSTTASTAAATITGTPTVLGTTSNIIVDVTDSEAPAVTTKFTYSLTVVVPCGSGSESLLSGQYAFVLSGFDSNGNVALIGGVLTASGASGSSNLTAGAVDMNLSGGVQTNLAIASGSNYTVGSDGRGCMSIVTTAGTQNYRFSVGASGNGHIIDFDAAGPFTTGVLRKQTASAFSTGVITGSYAFGVSSPQDSAQGGGKFGAMGVLNLSGGTVTSGSVDYNSYNANTKVDTLDGSTTATTWPALPIAISGSGAYTILSNGRGTLTFTPTGASAVNAYIYVVSSTEVLIISSDARTVNNPFAGVAFKQTGAPYSNSSLTGKSVLYSSKVSNNGGTPNSSLTLGIVNTTGASATFTFAGYNNGGGNISTPTSNSASGTFSVASNGRVTITVSGGGNQTPEFLLYGPGGAFALFSGNGAEDGFLEAQTATSVTNGNYVTGTFDPQTAGVSDNVGVVALTSGSATSTDDNNSQGTLSPNNAGTSTYSVDSTGVVFLPASCTPGATTGTICEKIGTIVTSSKIVVMNANPSGAGGTSNPAIKILDQ